MAADLRANRTGMGRAATGRTAGETAITTAMVATKAMVKVTAMATGERPCGSTLHQLDETLGAKSQGALTRPDDVHPQVQPVR